LESLIPEVPQVSVKYNNLVIVIGKYGYNVSSLRDHASKLRDGGSWEKDLSFSLAVHSIYHCTGNRAMILRLDEVSTFREKRDGKFKTLFIDRLLSAKPTFATSLAGQAFRPFHFFLSLIPPVSDNRRIMPSCRTCH